MQASTTGHRLRQRATIGAETHLPFGGTSKPGNGPIAEAAVAAIELLHGVESVYIDYSDKLQRAQIDNN